MVTNVVSGVVTGTAADPGRDPAAKRDASLRQAESARRSGDHAAALRLYLQAHQQRPLGPASAVDAAACGLIVGDLASAARLLAGQRPEGLADELATRLLFAQGLVLKRLVRPQEAVTCFEAALLRCGPPSQNLPSQDLPSPDGTRDLPVNPQQVSAAWARQIRRECADTLLNVLGDVRAAASVYAMDGPSPVSWPLDTPPPAVARDCDAWLGALVCGLYSGDVDAAALVSGFGALAARHLGAAPAPGARPAPRTGRKAGARVRRRPRIGFVSGQFCSSPVGFLTLGTLEHLAARADLVLFDRGSKRDWAHQRFRAAAAGWVECGSLDAATLAAQLADAGLDALFDLAGWMDLDVLRAFAARPAPRQFKWVGGQSLTTGLSCFNGFVADHAQVPAGCETLYAEPVVRLSGSYITYTSPPYRDLSAAAANPPSPRVTTPDQWAIVSNPAKIGRQTVDLVRRLAPRRLFLIDHRWRFDRTRGLAQAWFGDRVGSVEFIAPATHPQYLDALDRLDATVLDTAPYSMGLTAVELRLLGVPFRLVERPHRATMRELHASGHAVAPRFDHHRLQAEELLHCSTAVQ